MKTPESRIVADGADRLRRANNYPAMRAAIRAEVALRYESEKADAPLWRRIWIEYKIHREAAAELRKHFPPGALHVTAAPR
jgi:hypothetical protein